MKNPAKTLSDLCWLAGIIDGEGSIGISRFADTRPRRNVCYSPHLQITNCNEAIVKNTCRILKEMGIKHSKYKIGVENPKWNDYWMVSVTKLADVEEVCALMQGFLVGKKEQARVLLGFCRRRKAMKKRGSNGQFLEIIDVKSEADVGVLKRLNSKGKWKK